ncbi:MAG: dockerin type I repeat-containing protein [Ruminococcus sp.]|nr:dockerin type I repeat-containing protein [Ruminococcus sp.]
MKKIISILCIVAMMLSFTTICANAWAISDKEGEDYDFEPLSYVGFVGDVDSTDEVNIVDATYIQMHIAKLVELRGANYILANVDQSDSINIIDATCIQMWVAKLPVKAPIYHQLGDDDFGDHICSYSINFVSNKCQQGFVEYNCNECLNYYTSHEKEPSHDWEVVEVKEPDCTDGYTDLKCKDCGATDFVLDRGTGTGHDWGEWQVVTEPDYGIEGEEICYCSKCNAPWSRTLDMLIEGNQDAIAAAREFIKKPMMFTFFFDSVESLKKDEYRIKSVAYYTVPYEYEESTGNYYFKRIDLETALLKYLDTSYDWKSLNTTEAEYGDIEYYDEATDCVIQKFYPHGMGGGTQYRVSTCIDNGDGTYTFWLESKELGPYDWEPHTAELVLKKTEHGYPAVSLTKVEN